MNILLTGSAGFIGFHLAKKLKFNNHYIIGLDNLNDYYDLSLKMKRLSLSNLDKFYKINLQDTDELQKIFSENNIDLVINLAAQAGVRYSIENPLTYIDSNIYGFVNLLECMKNYGVDKLIYASSSSVYGDNEKIPFSEDDRVDNPVSLYAATKKANELIASVYSKMYGISCVGLRFFTVYGPYGRPDMAPMLFAKSIAEGKEIKVFNNGDMLRDFTYVDDIVEGIYAIVENGVKDKNNIYNIGRGKPTNLMDFIKCIENEMGKEAKKKFMDMQAGDVQVTYADCTKLEEDYGYRPNTDLDVGVKEFIKWFKDYGKKISD